MLALSRPGKQALATIAVVVSCIAPTAWVGWSAWSYRQPSHRRAMELELGRRTGFDVTIGDITYPRPSEIVLQRIGFTVPAARGAGEAGPPQVITAEILRFGRESGAWTLQAQGLRLRAESPRQVLALMEQAIQRTASAASRWNGDMHLIAPTCRIDLGDGIEEFRLHDLAATLRPRETGTRLTAGYRIDGGGESERCELVMERHGEVGTTATELAFKVLEGGSVAARVLDPFFDTKDWLGPSARLQGRLALHQSRQDDWEAEFQGALLDVDLTALMSQLAPRHGLNARARLDLDTARWGNQPGRGPGWTAVKGRVECANGTISAGLLQALKSQLRFRMADRLLTDRPEIPFQALGLTFDLTPRGELRLGGGLGPDALPGAVLVQSQRFTPLASAPEGEVTVAGLIRAFGPDQPEAMIPAHYESLTIQRFLPTPSPVEAASPNLRAN